MHDVLVTYPHLQCGPGSSQFRFRASDAYGCRKRLEISATNMVSVPAGAASASWFQQVPADAAIMCVLLLDSHNHMYFSTAYIGIGIGNGRLPPEAR
jgi:hypothetical protein